MFVDYPLKKFDEISSVTTKILIVETIKNLLNAQILGYFLAIFSHHCFNNTKNTVSPASSTRSLIFDFGYVIQRAPIEKSWKILMIDSAGGISSCNILCFLFTVAQMIPLKFLGGEISEICHSIFSTIGIFPMGFIHCFQFNQ